MPLTLADLNLLESTYIKQRRQTYQDFCLFRRYYFGHYHKCTPAVFHGEIAHMLGNATKTRRNMLAIAAPRGFAKSTIITMEYVVYSICYGSESFILLVSNTSEQACTLLQNVKRELESNERLQKDFPEVCGLGVKPGPARWSRNELITRNNVKVSAIGTEQNVRGRRHGEHRPTLIIMDDIETTEPVQSEESRFKLQDFVEKDILKCGASEMNVILTGTIHNYGCLLARYTNRDICPGWEGRVYRAVIKESEAVTEWQEWTNIFHYRQDYNTLRGPDGAKAYFEGHREKMLLGTEVLWAEHKSYYDLMVMREKDGQASFDSEMQNEPINPRDCCFNVDECHYWDEKYPDARELMKTMKNPTVVMACDPGLGHDQMRGDFSAILIGVRDSADDTLYVLEADVQRINLDLLLERLLAHAISWKARTLAIESNNFQEMLKKEFERRAREKQLNLTVKPVQHTQNKVARIQTLQPFLKSGKIQLSKKHRLLIDQLRHFPKGQHDDGPDALEMLFTNARQKSVHWELC